MPDELTLLERLVAIPSVSGEEGPLALFVEQTAREWGLDAVRDETSVRVEVRGRAPRLDLTASRRLTLAAERSGTTVLLIRGGTAPMSSAAHSRWEVASASSIPLAANAPGHPVFDLKLLRQRGGPDGLHVQLEWNREQAVFRTPLSGGASAVSARGTADRRRHRAA